MNELRVITPDLTMNVPSNENEKPNIHNKIVQAFNSFLISNTITE